MKRPPSARKVASALKDVAREVKVTLKQLNQQAGGLMSRGHYALARELAERGQALPEFRAKVEALRREWLALWTAKESPRPDGSRTPLWGYYRLVLRALVASGGRASRREVEAWVAAHGLSELQPGDLVAHGRKGKPRWKSVIGRVRTHMAREGYLVPSKATFWEITPLGRQVAAGEVKEEALRQGGPVEKEGSA